MSVKQNFLETVVASVRRDIREGVYSVTEPLNRDRRSLRGRLTGGVRVIAEIKPVSPSTGSAVVSPSASTARAFQDSGACGISVLAERSYFGGSPALVKNVAAAVSLPVLFKDFVVSAEQIECAKRCGADLVLLIAEMFALGLADESADSMVGRAHDLGLEVLFETHSERYVECINRSKAEYLGINNRSLLTLELKRGHFKEIVRRIEKTKPVVAESGYSLREEIVSDMAYGADAFLVGSAFMKATRPEEKLREMIGSD
jgi:indole-3-glycerol phosphate synthase